MVQKTLRFKLLGDFQFCEGKEGQWKSLGNLTVKGVGKKQVAFLTYLLLNHRRKISSEELIENFWPEDDSKDPVNVLKNTLHKTRVLLKAMFPECGELIVTQRGGYIWSDSVTLELDVDEIEQLYRKAKQTLNSERIVLEKKAFELYGGDILPGNPQNWLDHINTYYRNLYIDLCKSLAVLLQENEDWDEVIRVCKQAYTYAMEVEEITVCFMQSLIASGQPELAVHHYESYRAMLWQGYNLVPSEKVEQVYTLAVERISNSEDYEWELLRQITYMPEPLQAFHCGVLVFRHLVQMELRNILRNGHESSVVVLRALRNGTNQTPSTDARRVERTLMSSLRAGDPFTKLNMGSFVLLLPGASQENAQKVMQRVDRNFHSTYPRSKAVLQYRVYPLTAQAD